MSTKQNPILVGLAISSIVVAVSTAVADEVLEHVHFIPAVAHVNGAGGMTWRSDVALHNPGSGDAAVELVFLESGADNSNAPAHGVTVPPATSVHLADIVAELFGQSAPTGAILVRSDEPLKVTSKTFNDSPDGTFGQVIPGFPVSQALRTGAEARLIQLFRSPTTSGGFRTNVGFAEAAGVSTQLEVTLYRGSGQMLGVVLVTLLAYEHTQINDIFGEVVEGSVNNGYAVIRTRSQNAAYFAYASVVDNLSGDPVFLPATVTPDWITQAGVWSPTELREISVNALTTDPFDSSRVVVATRGYGLHVSDDWGAGWSRVSSGLEEDEAFAVTFSSTEADTIFAGTWHQEIGNWRGGIYKSVDGGASWSKRRSTHVRAIAVHPENGSVILVGTQGSGIYRSVDGGESWSTSSSGLGNPYVKSVAFAASPSGLAFAATENGIDMSRDGGASWTHSGLEYFFESIAVHPMDSAIVYTSRAVMNGGTLYQSLDGGQSWSEVESAPPRVRCLVFDPSPPNTLYVGTADNGVWAQETDGSWIALNDGLTDLRVNALAVSIGDPRFLYAGTAGDFTTIDDGAVFVMQIP